MSQPPLIKDHRIVAPATPTGQPASAEMAAGQEGAVRPASPLAQLELRHKMILLSFGVLVLLPTLVSGWYLWARAEDQYISTVAFSVRNEEAATSLDVLGGLSKLTGGGSSAASDTDILYDFLRSEDIVARIEQAIELRSKFTKAWPGDPVFALSPSASIEALTRYWKRRVHVLYDTSTRILTLEVSAFTREDAYTVARAAFEESGRTINRLSDIAREDATRFSRSELAKTQDRLTQARQALTAFRMRTQIIDPMADLAGQMGILNSLQAQLAEAIVALDTLRDNAGIIAKQATSM